MTRFRLPQRIRFSPDFYKSLLLVLVLAIGVIAVLGYLRFTLPPDETTYIPGPEVMTREIELLQRYVRIDTSNPPGNELAGARFLLDELKRSGIEAELIESAPGRASVYARIRGDVPDQGLLLLHHIDVVPADPGAWTKPPFGAEIFLGQMWGRGTLDMKGFGICQLEAFRHLAQSGRRLRRDLVFLATADEEAGGKLGMAWLLENRPDIFKGVRYAINEGGIPEMQAEKLTYFGVEVGTKQFVKLRLHSASRQALQKTRIALEPLIEPFDPERILPQVREFFRAIAPYRIQGRAILEDVDRAVEEGEFWRLQTSFRALTQNIVVPLGIEEEGGRFGMDLYLHNLPDAMPHRVIQRVEGMVRPFGVTIEVVDTMGPTTISEVNTPVFDLITRLVKRYHGPDAPVGPLILAYATNDSRYLRARGIDCYGLWPFLVDFHQSQTVHAENERVRLEWFMQGIRLTKDLVVEYCGSV